MSTSWHGKRVPGSKGSDSEVPPKANLPRWDFRQLLSLSALEARAKYLLLPHRLLFSFLDRLIQKPKAKPMNSVEHPVCGSYYIRSSCATQRVFSGRQQQRAAWKTFPTALSIQCADRTTLGLPVPPNASSVAGNSKGLH